MWYTTEGLLQSDTPEMNNSTEQRRHIDLVTLRANVLMRPTLACIFDYSIRKSEALCVVSYLTF
jgi:hypothetical protein